MEFSIEYYINGDKLPGKNTTQVLEQIKNSNGNRHISRASSKQPCFTELTNLKSCQKEVCCLSYQRSGIIFLTPTRLFRLVIMSRDQALVFKLL